MNLILNLQQLDDNQKKRDTLLIIQRDTLLIIQRESSMDKIHGAPNETHPILFKL
jgi:hypothetical protein